MIITFITSTVYIVRLFDFEVNILNLTLDTGLIVSEPMVSRPVLHMMIMIDIIISGKILDDEKKVEEYKIEEKNFVVVMVTKVSNQYCFS